ncbi:MAG: hypothetical protein AMJ69_06245 [Gammaproteobacteria bacterium SG8_47]|nr:MAG: hypothetical protein AMJ69_06245 [Gammaproteobacteria bacterium SG8_47]
MVVSPSESRGQHPQDILPDREIDLRLRGDVPPHTFAYYHLRDLHHGEACSLISSDDPTLIMETVNVLTRHRFGWELTDVGPPVWRAVVQLLDDANYASLVELLEEDHVRLDVLFANAMHNVNAGKLERARTYFQDFAIAIRRHVYAEDNVVLPLLSAAERDRFGSTAQAVGREHADIVRLVDALQLALNRQQDSSSDLAVMFRDLSETLAKHEAREELMLFPAWDVVLKSKPNHDLEHQLVVQVHAILDGDKDAALIRRA